MLLLLLLYELILDQMLNLGWVVLGDICDTFTARADKSLEGEIVAGRQRIVLIDLDIAACAISCILIELILFEHYLQLLEVDGDRILAD